MPGFPLQAAVIVTSDRCASGKETDISGTYLQAALTHHGFLCGAPRIVTDDFDKIQDAIRGCLSGGARLVITSGGTGASKRDVTPEAVASFIRTPLPGVQLLLMQASLAETPYAAFSRGNAGLTDTSPNVLIVSVPGSKNAAETAARTLFPLLKHLFTEIDQQRAPEGAYRDHHSH